MQKMKRYIIDRIEDEIAVCENESGAHEEFAATSMPDGAKEGDCLTFCEDSGEFAVDIDETQRRRRHIMELLRRAQGLNDD